MARTKQSKGSCLYCGHETTKGAMSRHLSACPRRREAIDTASQTRRPVETLFHLRVQDSWGGKFWLDLEVCGSSTLASIDGYLRAIWLECCGHLSQFSTVIPFHW